MGEFKTGRISLRSRWGENKTGQIQSCLQYILPLYMYSEKKNEIYNVNAINISKTNILITCTLYNTSFRRFSFTVYLGRVKILLAVLRWTR